MSYEEDHDSKLIVRFLLQEASEQDIMLLRQRLEEDPAFKRHFEQIRDTWNQIELEKELDDAKIKRDLDKVLSKTSKKPHKKLITGFEVHSWIFKAAAIFIVGFSIAWGFFTYQYAPQRRDVSYNTIEIPKGSNSVVNLPDGSRITLNAQSKLTYPDNFSGKTRKVDLEGEAFFEVVKDEDRTFEVNTPDLLVRVHGTSFNIKSYADENTVETTLVEGSISLFRKSANGDLSGREIKMEPNQQLVLYKGTESPDAEQKAMAKPSLPKPVKPKLMLSKRIDTEQFVSWKDGLLKIKSEPLDKLATTLERRYNVNIHFADKQMMHYRFSGTIRDETIEQVMAAIKLASSIDYEIKERNIFIKSKE